MMGDIWDTAHLTSFWEWTPETWGSVGFSYEEDRGAIVAKTTDPFIMVVYITKNSSNADSDVRGKVTGFYLVSHKKGHRDDFTSSVHHKENPGKWQYALRAMQAFSILPEYRPDIEDVCPDVKTKGMNITRRGKELSGNEKGILARLPYVEVPCYKGLSRVDNMIYVPQSGEYKVRGGPARRTSYLVDGEPIDTEKELYCLKLQGDVSVFLGNESMDLAIYKIGLSMSPKSRLASFQKTLPETFPQKGKIRWVLHRTTQMDGHGRYPDFDAAIRGEDAMKEYLGKNAVWLGGEFYAASEDQFETAWKLGHESASGM